MGTTNQFAMSIDPGSKKRGAIPYQTIHEMIKAGFIEGAAKPNVRPASLDLSVSDEAYIVDGIFQPRCGETVRQVLAQVVKKTHSLSKPLQTGEMYIVRLNEKMELPSSVYGFCNPKSTSGRNDVHVRVIADGVPRYDALTPSGWRGELWMSIIPKTFPIKLSPGQTLAQLRLFNSDTRLDELELEIALKEHRLIWDQEKGAPLMYEDIKVRDNDHSIILTLDLRGDIVGYEGVATTDAIDLSKVGHFDPKKFFKPVYAKKGYVNLKKNKFYILSTLEAVRVPPSLACEMVSMDERSGEFRSHYAGFIDPGWGWGKKGEGKGRPLTLEVRPFEDLMIRHGQPIAKIRFERVAELPGLFYDATSSNYIQQSGPKLSKYFKAWA